MTISTEKIWNPNWPQNTEVDLSEPLEFQSKHFQVIPVVGDLSSISEVHHLAEQVRFPPMTGFVNLSRWKNPGESLQVKENCSSLDLLICNAGVFSTSFQLTSTGTVSGLGTGTVQHRFGSGSGFAQNKVQVNMITDQHPAVNSNHHHLQNVAMQPRGPSWTVNWSPLGLSKYLEKLQLQVWKQPLQWTWSPTTCWSSFSNLSCSTLLLLGSSSPAPSRSRPPCPPPSPCSTHRSQK